jgi:uncharacterized membrane protein
MRSTEFLIALVLIPLIDAPWLIYQSAPAKGMFESIQGGRPLQMRLWAALVVYIALAYLLLQQTSIQGAFLAGAATYAVYDFTNLAFFKDYTLKFALMDSIWGGTLFAIAYWVLGKIRKSL